jgi:hypothetical protein
MTANNAGGNQVRYPIYILHKICYRMFKDLTASKFIKFLWGGVMRSWE